MLTRWIPTDRLLKRALVGLVAGVVLSVLAGGLSVWDEQQHNWPNEEREALAQAVSQHGPSSSEAAAVIKRMGETTNPKDVVALLDPETGKAVAAWPADLTGKTPEEITVAGNTKLPPLTMLAYREHITLPRPNAAKPSALAPYETDKVSVRLSPLYPWSDEGPGRRFSTARNAGDGKQEARWDENRGRHGRGDTAALPRPQAFLLVAAPPAGVTWVSLLAGFASGLAAVGLMTYWLGVAWWGYRDARRRGDKPFAWGVLILLTNLVGVAVYLVARKDWRDCPSCAASIEKSFRHCPHCGHELKPVCTKCGRALRGDWAFCADCGTPHVTQSLTSGAETE